MHSVPKKLRSCATHWALSHCNMCGVRGGETLRSLKQSEIDLRLRAWNNHIAILRAWGGPVRQPLGEAARRVRQSPVAGAS